MAKKSKVETPVDQAQSIAADLKEFIIPGNQTPAEAEKQKRIIIHPLPDNPSPQTAQPAPGKADGSPGQQQRPEDIENNRNLINEFKRIAAEEIDKGYRGSFSKKYVMIAPSFQIEDKGLMVRGFEKIRDKINWNQVNHGLNSILRDPKLVDRLNEKFKKCYIHTLLNKYPREKFIFWKIHTEPILEAEPSANPAIQATMYFRALGDYTLVATSSPENENYKYYYYCDEDGGLTSLSYFKRDFIARAHGQTYDDISIIKDLAMRGNTVEWQPTLPPRIQGYMYIVYKKMKDFLEKRAKKIAEGPKGGPKLKLKLKAEENI